MTLDHACHLLDRCVLRWVLLGIGTLCVAAIIVTWPLWWPLGKLCDVVVAIQRRARRHRSIDV